MPSLEARLGGNVVDLLAQLGNTALGGNFWKGQRSRNNISYWTDLYIRKGLFLLSSISTLKYLVHNWFCHFLLSCEYWARRDSTLNRVTYINMWHPGLLVPNFNSAPIPIWYLGAEQLCHDLWLDDWVSKSTSNVLGHEVLDSTYQLVRPSPPVFPLSAGPLPPRLRRRHPASGGADGKTLQRNRCPGNRFRKWHS